MSGMCWVSSALKSSGSKTWKLRPTSPIGSLPQVLGGLSDHKGNYVESKPPTTPKPPQTVPVITTGDNLTDDAEKT